MASDDGTPMTQADRLKTLMGRQSIRSLARDLAGQLGKDAEAWRQQITRWRGGLPISDRNAEVLAVHYEADRDYLKAAETKRNDALLAEQLEELASTMETRLGEIEARLASLER